MRVDPMKVSTVMQWESPTTVTSVQSSLSFCSFYRRFSRHYRDVSKPLKALIYKNQEFLFIKACIDAFNELKIKLTTAPVLAHFNPSRKSHIELKASDGVIVAVFSQLDDNNKWHFVVFFSKTMTPAELNNEILVNEFLAIKRTFH